MTSNDYAEPAAPLTSGRMPLLGFGTWQISNREAPQATVHAMQAGYRHIDTATMYQNETGIGRALASADLPRDSVFVTTKLPPSHAGRERRTLGESLAKLGLEKAIQSDGRHAQRAVLQRWRGLVDRGSRQ